MSQEPDDQRATIRREPSDEPPDTARNPERARRSLGETLDQTLVPSAGLEQRYQTLESLGRGGMGEVTGSYDVKIGREIAVKTMLPTEPRAQAQASARFVREARIQALLEHPAIVPVYDIDAGQSGLAYFTMKRIRGETLAEVVARAKFERDRSPERGARTGLRKLLNQFVTVCEAIHYAHERGVVHRDLKPENVMLGAHGEVYVLDWGVAKIITREAPRPAELDTATRPGEMVGTPGFMPPEQVMGHHDLIDARSDVYALGAMLYELVTLEPMHPGALATVVESTLNPARRPTPPPDAPPELCALALRAATFRIEQRLSSAREIVQGIERYLDGDRDGETRQRLARDRANAARIFADVALHGEANAREHARVSAMREASRALALAPSNGEAAAIIVELLAAPPDAVPTAVAEELARSESVQQRQGLRDNVVRVLAWMLFIPFGFWMGIRDVVSAAVILGFYALTLGASLMLVKRGAASPLARSMLCAITSAFVGTLAGLFGPLVMVPAIAGMNTLLFSVQATKVERPWMIALGCLALVVPLALELTGILPPSMRFEAGEITILPRTTELPPVASCVFLTLLSVGNVVAPTLLAGRIREALHRAERDLVVQKWQLTQMASNQ